MTKPDAPHAADHAAGMQALMYDLLIDWDDIAFASKKPIKQLRATFIAAPRQISTTRFKQLIKEYLPKGNVVIGLAKEQYIDGFNGQSAFRSLQHQTIQDIITKVNTASPKHKIYTLAYFQRDMPYLIEKLDFTHVILVRGSWHKVFHTSPAFYALVKQQIPYTYVSPFADEAEARAFADMHDQSMNAQSQPAGKYSAKQLIAMCTWAAEHSLDYTFQTGVVLAKKSGSTYKLLLWSYNRVLPYQTYAMHHGNSREDNFSPSNDLNHYDAIHAEMNLLITAAEQHIDLNGTSLFINILPCPTCARVLSQTSIADVFYSLDHSSSYAIDLFSAVGKRTRLLA